MCCQGVYLTFEWAVSVTKHAHTDSLCSYLLVARNLMSHTCPGKSNLVWVETGRTKKKSEERKVDNIASLMNVLRI